MSTRTYQAILELPHGAVGLCCTANAILEIEYLPPQPAVAPSSAIAREGVRQLRRWLDQPDFCFDLPLAAAGTAFQRRVWQAICAIDCGATRTYGEMARELGSAPRAVGQACGANPFPIVVPCHRVVSASAGFNGGLGGFAHATGGYLLDIKRWLLAREGAVRAA